MELAVQTEPIAASTFQEVSNDAFIPQNDPSEIRKGFYPD